MFAARAIQAHRLVEIAATWATIRARRRLGLFTEIEELGGFDFRNRMHADAIRRKDRRARGLCVRCAEPSPDRYLCPLCMALQARRSTRYRESLARQGVCVHCCTRAAAPGLRSCTTCLEKRNGRRGRAALRA